jgi:hypothetical protein
MSSVQQMAGLNLSWDTDYCDRFFEVVSLVLVGKYVGSSLFQGMTACFQIISSILVNVVQSCCIVFLVTDSFIKDYRQNNYTVPPVWLPVVFTEVIPSGM